MTSIGLDSNVLLYLAGVERAPMDAAKIATARSMVRRLRAVGRLVAPVQALGEMYTVLVRTGRSRDSARREVVQAQGLMSAAPSRTETLEAALDLAVDHKLQLWDALILAAAGEAGCALLLSEDMQDGFTALGVTVVNPFAAELDRRLARLLA